MEWCRKITATVLIVVLLGGITGCLSPVRKPLTTQTYDLIIKTSASIQNEDWGQAGIDINDLRQAWKKVKPMIQLNHSTETIDEFESTLSRLEGYVINKDKSNSQAEVNLLLHNWQELRTY